MSKLSSLTAVTTPEATLLFKFWVFDPQTVFWDPFVTIVPTARLPLTFDEKLKGKSSVTLPVKAGLTPAPYALDK